MATIKGDAMTLPFDIDEVPEGGWTWREFETLMLARGCDPEQLAQMQRDMQADNPPTLH